MTNVKICGITNLEDATVAVEAGADLLGFIFYEPSPRYVRPEAVGEIVVGVRSFISDKPAGSQFKTEHLKLKTPTFVGVFVNAAIETVARILDECQLDAAQLHGDESPEFVKQFHGRAYKALRPQSLEEAETLIKTYQPTSQPANKLPDFLIDAYHPTLYGGTGHVTDWTMAASLAGHYRIMLAGSLTPDNVAEAIEAVKPWGVDVSSGVEREKGKKDHGKVREFIRRAQSVERNG
jgi:phosphoribosylanthranilate isomerase